MIKQITFILLFLLNWMSFSQSGRNDHAYTVDIDVPEKQIFSTRLKMGGSNPNGESISVNNYYISKNKKPIIPVIGEFHFSRYPRAYWDESIKKMKAGGINTMATYVFWNMHEENEGDFNWTGNRNLREFIKLCAKNDMPVVIRIGPFCHGEIRSGGLPDWLLAKPLTIRTNDPDYLFYAERLYQEIGYQLEGLYFKDGGPIIATQIENEFQHSAAPWGLTYPGQPYDMNSSERDKALTKEGVGISSEENPYTEMGNDHMKVLMSLAIKAGIETPLYTATGWGNAAIIPNETIPVTAAYPYPTWTDEPDISPFYLYEYMHKKPDYSPVRYEPENYLAIAAELGGGIMSTYDRRPVVPASSLDSLINRCLGSGVNGIGYYMYHGGSTPKGEHYFFNDEAYGYPKISYDFQAPIGEYGKVKKSFHRLKLVHGFINNFGHILAPMQTLIPESNLSINPTNTEALRFAVRHRENSGFLFLNNFQDDTLMNKKENIQIEIKIANGSIKIPEEGGFDLMPNENAIFPFNFDLNGISMNYATAQLFTSFNRNDVQYYVFFAPEGVKPELSFEASPGMKVKKTRGTSIKKNGNRWKIVCDVKTPSEFIIQKNDGTQSNVLVISKEQALKAWLVNFKKGKHIIFSEAEVLQTDEEKIDFLSKGNNVFEFFTYPKLKKKSNIEYGQLSSLKSYDLFSHFEITVPEVNLPYNTNIVSEKRLVVNFKGGIPDGLNDVLMKIDYVGDTAWGL